MDKAIHIDYKDALLVLQPSHATEILQLTPPVGDRIDMNKLKYPILVSNLQATCFLALFWLNHWQIESGLLFLLPLCGIACSADHELWCVEVRLALRLLAPMSESGTSGSAYAVRCLYAVVLAIHSADTPYPYYVNVLRL